MYALDPYNKTVYDLENIRDELTKYRTRLIKDHKEKYEEVKDDAAFIYNEINDKEDEE